MARVIPKGWRELEIKDFLKFTPREIEKPNGPYRALGIRSHCKGTFIREVEDSDKVMMETLYEVKKDDLIVNITFAWEGAVALVNKSDEGALVSYRFLTYVFDRDVVIPEYFKYLIPSKRFVYELGVISPGGAGRNRVLDRKDFMHLRFVMPPVDEQKKIAQILSTWDRAIEQVINLIRLNIEFRKGLIRKLISGKLRIPKFNKKWETTEIGEVLDYEQPPKYLVDKILDYDVNLVPVLTANKSFILGSTDEKSGVYVNVPVVIFDDFTTDSKYVDFPFKVKSSAIKFLKAKNKDVNLRFVYEFMKMIRFTKGAEHKRFYISEYQFLSLDLPEINEQNEIANIAKCFEKNLKVLEHKLDYLQKQRNGLIQKLLTGKIRVKI